MDLPETLGGHVSIPSSLATHIPRDLDRRLFPASIGFVRVSHGEQEKVLRDWCRGKSGGSDALGGTGKIPGDAPHSPYDAAVKHVLPLL